MTIFIRNPIPGGSSYTSDRKAHEFVKQGRAKIEDGELVFISRAQRVFKGLVYEMKIVDGWTFPHYQWFRGKCEAEP